MTTRAKDYAKQTRARRSRRRIFQVAIAAVVILAAVAGLLLLLGGGEEETVDFPDIHGMGFTSDGRQLVAAVHDGLRIFEAGQWRVADVPRNDYMGYSPVDVGFYSSGHPGPSVSRVNPFGLVKSSDGGRTLTTLGFEGESDFHTMAVGYENHAIYVLNARPNSRLGAGLHYSLDEGATWNQSSTQGIDSTIFQIAAHPTEASRIAAATEGGVFLSSDYGQTFERLGEVSPVTAVSFSPVGDYLFFGHTTLYRYALADGEISALETPSLSDPIAYIAINPILDEVAFATFGKDVHLSQDGGQSWELIADDGIGRN